MAQGEDVGILAGVGIGVDGLHEELRGVGMHEIVPIAACHHEVRTLVGHLRRDDLREAYQREVGGDDAYEVLVLIVQWFAVGGNHAVEGEGQGVALVVIDHPAGFPQEVRLLIPHLLEILVGFFDDGGDGVCFTDGIGGEVPAVFREDVRFGADGTAVDMSVEHDDASGDGEDGVRIQIGGHLPVVDVGGCFHDVHIAGDMLHRGVYHTGGVLRCLFFHLVPGMDEEETYRQDEDGNGHEQDAQTELPGERLADMCNYVAHLFIHCP